MTEISKIKYNGDLKAAVDEVVQSIGGWEKFIKTGDKVLLKPNFNTADPFPASTDPAFLRAVVELVLQAGAGEVIIGDSCTLSQKTNDVMNKLGIFEFNKIEKVKVVNFDEGEWIKKDIGGKYLGCVSLPKIINEVDKLILLPCLKTHFIAKFTGALKISVGFMKPLERLALHIGKVPEKVAELNKVFNPDLIIMDGRKCFIDKGPSEGTVRKPNLILASTGRVAIDCEGINIIKSFAGNSLADLSPENLVQIKVAKQQGII